MIGLLGDPKARTEAFYLIEGVSAGFTSNRQMIKSFERIQTVLDLPQDGKLAAGLTGDICAITDAVRKLTAISNQ
ncbi:hypothetical protein [Thioclava sp.]|uniref:hypothetical protein n=1 Tax=Thioclava sp. TaxID=1933450 RepID=UPI003AA82183